MMSRWTSVNVLCASILAAVLAVSLSTGCANPYGQVKSFDTTDLNTDEAQVTIFLRHNPDMSFDETMETLGESKFYPNFPPEGADIERWDVVMGIGQVVTLSVPPKMIPQINSALEQRAWGAFEPEFYQTYEPQVPYKLASQNRDDTAPSNAVLLTVLVDYRANSRRTGRNQWLDRSGFYKYFPPEDVDVVAVRELLGLGTMYTLRVPPSKMANVQSAVDVLAAEAVDVEVYPSYNFLPTYKNLSWKPPANSQSPNESDNASEKGANR